MKGKILVTGGTGYIGSHTCLTLASTGYDTVLIDNLSNSSRSVIGRLNRIAGQEFLFLEGDIRDTSFLQRVFAEHRIDAVIHFAGLKAVGESVAKPLIYYDNNVTGTITLLEVMERCGVRRIVFSSSATVYGEACSPPMAEDGAIGPSNPYGRTKLVVEQVLSDLVRSNPEWRAILLRYFNPVGAHESGMIGEDPGGVPNNLMPYVSQVAAGTLQELRVFGNDYPTPDGTGVRDYIHVLDLALGHVAAIQRINALGALEVLNLGTGRGYSVLDVIRAFERASNRKVPFKIAPRRLGDIAVSLADPRRAGRLLDWHANRELDAMCRDAWRWQQWRAMHEDAL